MDITAFILWFLIDIFLCATSAFLVAREAWSLAVFTGLTAIICAIMQAAFIILLIWKNSKK